MIAVLQSFFSLLTHIARFLPIHSPSLLLESLSVTLLFNFIVFFLLTIGWALKCLKIGNKTKPQSIQCT